MERVVVIGAPGSGKTTMAEQLSARLQCVCVDLDALFWGPNWTASTPELFRARAAAALAGPRWTVSGNYRALRDLTWRRADTLIWLDYTLAFTYARLLQRTFRRIVSREELWAGNRETWRNALFSRDSLLWFMPKTHYSRKHAFFQELTQPDYRHIQVLRFTQPGDTKRWLETV